MNKSQLPEKLPAGTWIRTGYGPTQTYAEATLIRPGERGRWGVRDHYCYESGEGSATLNFVPERVLWDTVFSVEARAQVEKICADFFALGDAASRASRLKEPK